MIEEQKPQTLLEAWHEHITRLMNGKPMQSEEYRDRQADYLTGALDALTVYAASLEKISNGGFTRLTTKTMADTFYQLLEDTTEQHENLIDHMQKELDNALPNSALDDKP